MTPAFTALRIPLLLVVFLQLAGTTGCTSDDKQVVVFHAASLSGALARLEERLERRHAGLDIRLEPSGSQVAARKVSELKRKADLVFVADHRIIDEIMIPEHTAFSLLFASNEIVLAHGEHSRYTEEVTTDNWPEVLLRSGVRLGRGNENLAPIGYHTLLAWKLAEKHYQSEQGRDLASRLTKRVPPERIAPDIAELVSQLESRALDYAFVFRSIAEEHNLKVTALPPECNLSLPELASVYARVSVDVKMKPSRQPVTIRGSAIVYGLTVPKEAQNSSGAELVVAELLGPDGRRVLKQFGFRPLEPAVCPEADRLPAGLQPLVREKVSP
jgi:molybdate/tungstate transport system substrate-binding protein